MKRIRVLPIFTELSDIQSAFAPVRDKFDRVDLVINAGYGRHLEELSDRQIGIQKEVNFVGLPARITFDLS